MAYSDLSSTADQSAATQQQNAALLLQQLQGLNAPYTQNIAGQVTGATNATTALGNQYVADTTNASDALGSSLSDSLMQKTMQANAQTDQALKESLAATGGLQRGGADAAFQGQAANVANTIGQGQQSIVQQQLAARLGAMGTAYGNNNTMIGTGLNANTAAAGTVLNNNINANTGYFNGLNSIEQNRANNVMGAETAQDNANLAQTSASNQMAGNLIGAGIGAIGSVAGGMYGGPIAQKAGALATSSLGRGAVQTVG